MKKQVSALIGIAAALAISGCASVYHVSEAPATPTPAPVPPTRRPVALVRATATDAKAGGLAAAVKASAERNLASRGFDVGSRAKPDSILTLAVSRREAAELADWRVYEGKVDVRVTDAATSAVVADTSISAKGERGLGVAKAEENLARALERPLGDWLSRAMPARKVPVSATVQPARAAVMVTLSPADPAESPNDALVVQRRFMRSVGTHPGILSCFLAQEIPARRAFVFRVEYLPDQFPDGLLNTLVLDCPRLGGGVKLEIVR